VRKTSKLLAVLLALAVLATACGGSDSETVEADTSAADSALADAQQEAEDFRAEAEAARADALDAQAEADEARAEAAAANEAAAAAADDGDDAPAPPALPFEGEIVNVTGPEVAAADWNAIEAAFTILEDETGMEIIYTGSADWEDQIDVQLAANNPPDISVFPQPGNLADKARAGQVQALPADVLSEVAAQWPAATMAFGEVDGTQFGVPNKSDLKSLVWHKPARFEENGYDVPQSWDELLALTDQMIADGNTPWCIGIESGGATGWTFTDWTEDLLLRFESPEVYDQWVANEIDFSDERIVSIFEQILDLWNTPDAVFATGGSIATTNHSSGPAESLVADDCMMVRQASFFSTRLPEGTSDDVNVFYFPSVDPDVRPVLGAGTLVGAFTDRPAVWEVMEFMGSAAFADARQISQRAELGGGLSGFNTANLNVNRDNWAPLEQSFIGILQEAAIFRFDGSDLMPQAVGNDGFWENATAMVNGEKTPAEAAADIDAIWASLAEAEEEEG